MNAERGVTRETIRFYIRHGLLPEPEKPKRNVAIYTDHHIERIGLIWKLQDEQFLPLHVIRKVIAQGDEDKVLPGLPVLELAIRARLGARSGSPDTGPAKVKELLADHVLDQVDLDALVSDGLITVLEKDGEQILSGQDTDIVRIWAQIKANGFDEAVSYGAHDLKIYHDLCKELAGKEVARFFDRVSGKISTERAAQMSASSMIKATELMGLLYVKEVLNEVSRQNSMVRTPKT